MSSWWEFKGVNIRDYFNGRVDIPDLEEIFWSTDYDDVLRGNAKDNHILAKGGDDWVYGDGGDDLLRGASGDDFLYGGAGDDLIDGSNGDDLLSGGEGNDILRGGRGDDTFIYRTREFGEDTIRSFQRGEDKIDLRGTGLSWSDLKISATGAGGHENVIVDTGGGNRILVEYGRGLDKSDFLFGDAPVDKKPPEETRPILSISDIRVNEGDTATVRIELSEASDKDVTFHLSMGSDYGPDQATIDMQSLIYDYKITDDGEEKFVKLDSKNDVEKRFETTNDHVSVIDKNSQLQDWHVTIKAGHTTAELDIRTLEDTHDEYDELFYLRLSNPKNARFVSDPGATVTIVDDDSPPEVSIGKVKTSEDGTAVFYIDLSHPSQRDVKVHWSIADGKAHELIFHGYLGEQTRKIVTIDASGKVTVSNPSGWPFHEDVVGRTFKEFMIDAPGDKGYTFALSSPQGATLGAKHTATVAIADDDASPVVEPPESETVPSDAEPGEQDRLPLGTDDTLPQSNTESENAPPSRAAVAGTMAADTLAGTSGADALDGLAGNDTAQGLGGDDRLWGRQGADTLYGNAGSDRLWGGRDGDELHGGVGKDHLYGGLGHDTLYGGRGDDTLHGGRLADRLHGGEGKDVLVGGHGRDLFVYDDADFGRDRIVDFEDGMDRLDFTGSGLQWGDLSVSNNGKGDAVVRVDGANGKIVLEGVDASLIDQNDFIF